MPKEFH